MKTLIKSATIIDDRSNLNGKKRDLLIENGKITRIATSIPNDGNFTEISGKGLCASPGWFDMQAQFCDPGNEYKEDIQSGLTAAAHGGFTGVLISPDTVPPADNKSSVEYAMKRADGHVCELKVCGALSQQTEGKQLAEMFDMHSSGALAFGDGKKPVNNTELMSRALEYAQNFNGQVLSFPYDPGMNPDGLMHEGKSSVSLGLKGIPSAAEEIRLMRDIELLRYTGGKLHVTTISTRKSIALVKSAKKEGLNITCAVAAHQLSFLDEDLATFDTRLKVLPPLREKDDQKAIISGLKDGTIDAICSDHTPEDVEHKKCEFDNAAFGISSLETTFPALRSATDGKLDLAQIVRALSANPRKILGLDEIRIEEGEQANLTLFYPDVSWTFDKSGMKSKSDNTPYNGYKFKGKVAGVVRGKQVVLND